MHTDHITTLPLAQRLQMMEALWDSLTSDTTAEAAIPAWHEKVLSQRTATDSRTNRKTKS